MRWLYLIRPVLILSGSAGSPSCNLVLNKSDQIASDIAASWVGISQDDLLIAWGTPRYSLNRIAGCSTLTYLFNRPVNKYGLTARNPVPDFETCAHLFFVEQGIITKWLSTGGLSNKKQKIELQ